jgi:hypothetical protein
MPGMVAFLVKHGQRLQHVNCDEVKSIATRGYRLRCRMFEVMDAVLVEHYLTHCSSGRIFGEASCANGTAGFAVGLVCDCASKQRKARVPAMARKEQIYT